MASAKSRAILYTEDAYAGGDRRFLDRLMPNVVTRVTGLQWSTSYPGGDTTFQANLTAPPDLAHFGLRAGRRVYIMCGGATRWTGFLDNPQRGDPWQISGTGLASMVTDWAGTASTLDTSVDAAISRGLPYNRNGVSLDASITSLKVGTLDTQLAQVGRALGKAWTLDSAGNIAMAAPPTSATYVLDARQPLNPALVGYTQAVGLYGTNSTVTVTNAAAQQKYGKREGFWDMTSLGTGITSTTATNALTNWLNANLANWRYTNTLTVYRGQLKTPGGGVVDLASVRAGCMVLLTDVDPSHQALISPGQMTMLVGATRYDADSDVLTLTPVGMKGQDLLSIIYQATGGAL